MYIKVIIVPYLHSTRTPTVRDPSILGIVYPRTLGMTATRLLCACFFFFKLSDCALTRDNALAAKYSFSASLDEDQNYWLYWKVDHDEGVASFAVQANAVGWIGFGISPDGNVPNSDVVTGWVANGKGYLQVRSDLAEFRERLVCDQLRHNLSSATL